MEEPSEEFIPFSDNIMQSMPYCISRLKIRKKEHNAVFLQDTDEGTAVEIVNFLMQRNLWATFRRNISRKHVANFITTVEELKEREDFLSFLDTVMSIQDEYQIASSMSDVKLLFRCLSSVDIESIKQISNSWIAPTNNEVAEIRERRNGNKRAILDLIFKFIEERGWTFAEFSSILQFSPDCLQHVLSLLHIVELLSLKADSWAGLSKRITRQELEQLWEREMDKIDRLSHYMAEKTVDFLSMSDELDILAVAVYCINNFCSKRVHKDFKLRDTQILALILCVSAKHQKQKRILQIETGEGKTYSIAALSIYGAIRGHWVDIVTSSEELAGHMYAELKDLFSLIGIKAATNIDHKAQKLFQERNMMRRLDRTSRRADQHGFIREAEDYIDSLQSPPLYKSLIIIGTVKSFVSDYLVDLFYNESTELRCNRPFDMVITDEVDSLLLDERFNSVILSDSSPGMGQLLAIYDAIWQHVNWIYRQAKYINGQWIFASTVFNDDEQLFQAITFSVLNRMKKLMGWIPISKAEAERAKEQGVAFQDRTLKFPRHLTNFIKKQLSVWIHSATDARFMMEKNVDYIIKDGRKIEIIDADNTGAHHPEMQYQNALHQFLQMKHEIEVQPENLPTNFMSNVAFFLLYDMLIGVTGTIGGASSKKFLHDVYNTDFIDIPPHKERQHLELQDLLCKDDEKWLETIARHVITFHFVGRAQLIINPYIKNVDAIVHEILRLAPTIRDRITVYTDKDESIGKKILSCGDIIVCTNIGGRGTDFKVSEEVQRRGGLHVLLTKLPQTDRVERQNIGRTSRKGERGSSQMILNLMELDIDEDMEALSMIELMTSLREKRDQAALTDVENALEDVERLKTKDIALKEFLELRKKIVEKRDKIPIRQRVLKQNINSIFGLLSSTHEVYPELIRETFNMNFKQFFDTPAAAVRYVLAMGDPLKYSSEEFHLKPETKEFWEAMEILTYVISKDRNFAAAPLYLRARMYLELQHVEEIKDNCLDNAVKDFRCARKSLKIMSQQYHDICLSSSKNSTPLNKQMFRYLTVIRAILNNIDELIGREDIDEKIQLLEAEIKRLKEEKKKYKHLKAHLNNLINNYDKLCLGVIGMARVKDRKIILKAIKIKDALFQDEDEDEYKNEFNYFKAEGFKYLFSARNQKPVDRAALAFLVSVSTLQIGAGTVLFLNPVGLAGDFAIPLVLDGAYDLVVSIGYNYCYKGNFEWSDFILSKMTGLGITATTLGISHWKNLFTSAKSSQLGAKAAVTAVVSDTERHTISAYKSGVYAASRYYVKQLCSLLLLGNSNLCLTDRINAMISRLLLKILIPMLREKHGMDKNLKKLVAWDNRMNSFKYAQIVAQRLYPIDEKRSSRSALSDFCKQLLKLGIHNHIEPTPRAVDEMIKKLDLNPVKELLSAVGDKLPKLFREVIQEFNGREGPITTMFPIQITQYDFFKVIANKISDHYMPNIMSLMTSLSTCSIAHFGLGTIWDPMAEFLQYTSGDSNTLNVENEVTPMPSESELTWIEQVLQLIRESLDLSRRIQQVRETQFENTDEADLLDRSQELNMQTLLNILNEILSNTSWGGKPEDTIAKIGQPLLQEYLDLETNTTTTTDGADEEEEEEEGEEEEELPRRARRSNTI